MWPLFLFKFSFFQMIHPPHQQKIGLMPMTVPQNKNHSKPFFPFSKCAVVHLAAEIKSYWSLYLYILPHNPVPNIVIESSMIMDWIQYANAFNARYPQQIWVKYIWSFFLLSDYYKMQYTRVLYEAKVNKSYNLITQSSSLFAIKSEINLTGYISSTTFFSQFIKITEKQFLEQCR